MFGSSCLLLHTQGGLLTYKQTSKEEYNGTPMAQQQDVLIPASRRYFPLPARATGLHTHAYLSLVHFMHMHSRLHQNCPLHKAGATTLCSSHTLTNGLQSWPESCAAMLHLVHCSMAHEDGLLSNYNYQLPDGPVKAGRRWGQRHPQGASLGSNGILVNFLSKLEQWLPPAHPKSLASQCMSGQPISTCHALTS